LRDNARPHLRDVRASTGGSETGYRCLNYADPFGLWAWTEALAQGLANWGARRGGTVGAAAVNAGAALNAALEVTGINAAADAGDAIGHGDLAEGAVGVALTFAPLPGKGGGRAVAGRITGFTRHALNQAISRDGVGVATDAILGAVRSPVRVVEQSAGRMLFVGENASAVLNESGEVVTTWATTKAGTRIKK
jgi:hypothetical protein